MSVLVKGWSVPVNGCCGCHFRTGKYCGILDRNERVLEYAEKYTRPDNCPLVEVSTPVKHGKFIGTEYDGYADGNPVYYEWKCSECGCVFEGEEPTYRYCPNCGCRMDEE